MVVKHDKTWYNGVNESIMKGDYLVNTQYKEEAVLLESKKETNKRLHLPELDALSVIYCLMIVFIHVSSIVISD